MTTPRPPIRRAHIAVGAAVLTVAVVLLARFPAPVETPRTGALTATEKLTLTYEPALSLGEKTTLRLSDNRYLFGPGSLPTDSETASDANPLMLGLGGTVIKRPGYRLNTELGVGKMLDRDDFTLGESLTLFSSSLTRSLTQNLDLNADYSLLNGATTRSEDWALGIQYRISEQSEWQLQHREVRDQTGREPSDRVTRMEYRVQF